MSCRNSSKPSPVISIIKILWCFQFLYHNRKVQVRKWCVDCYLVFIPMRYCIANLRQGSSVSNSKREVTSLGKSKSKPCIKKSLTDLLYCDLFIFCYVNLVTALLSAGGGKFSQEEMCLLLPLGMLSTLEMLLVWHFVSQVITGLLLRWEK